MSHSTLIPSFRLSRRWAAAALLLLAALGGPARGARAQQAAAGTPSQTDPRPVARGSRRTGPIAIDGRLDDAAWAAAQPITQFTQQQPDEGRPASERTEVRILYDDQALYIGARMYERGGARAVRGVLTRRDALLDNASGLASDKIAVVFDPFRDRNTRVWFELNPLGVRGDQLNGDASWDPVWEGAAHVDSLGWTAEFRIPFSQLRFQGGAARTARTGLTGEAAGAALDSLVGDVVAPWGFQLWRYVTRRNEQDMWAFWRLNEAGGPAYFGTLTGLALSAPPRQEEIVPYVVTGDRFAAVTPGDPFHRTLQQRTLRAGADVKFLLTPSLTLDATVNPDFGQVEADPATVNLSAYETFYQEKRPFFVNNAGYFSFGQFNCFFCDNVSNLNVFYSRRIGRAPQLTGAVSDDAQFVDAPDVTSILGAATVTGRTRSGWTVGMLDALTGRATARFVPLPPAATSPAALPSPDPLPVRQQQVEPLTNYFLGRLRKDLRNGDTRVGGVLTLTNRALGDSLERTGLRTRAVVAGADVAHYWKDRTYSFLAQVAASDVGGDTAAIRATEQSSARYYQRPDRRVRSDGLFGAAYDPARTSLGGYALYARLAKDNGDWQWETAQNWRSPGFEVNDLAYLDRADYRWMLANVQRVWTKPTAWYRFASVIVGAQQQFNFDGDRNDAELHGGLFGTLANYWSVSLFGIHHPSNLDDGLTRGGPVERRVGYDFLGANVGTDARHSVVFNLGARRLFGIASEFQQTRLNPGITVKPSTRLLVSVSPSYSRTIDPQQFVTAVADPTAPAGFAGQRYIFSRLDQRTLSVETRVNTTFTPSLTLELYAQPFIASGSYSRFNEFAATRTLASRVYGRDLGTVCRDASGSYTLDPAAPVGTVCPAAGAAVAGFDIGNPNFNVRSLRGTAVLRWEYRPGSTLFAVWSQQRSGSASYGTFDFSRDQAALFRDRPVNVFQIKASYWIGR